MQPTFLWTYLNILAVGLAVVLVGKVLITTAILRLLRYPTNVALSVGVATAQVGEFGFVLLSKARAVGLVPVKVYLLLLGTTALSLLCTPLQWRLVNALNRGAPKGPRVSQQHELRGEEGGGGVGEGGEAAGHGERGKGSRSATDECATTPTRSGSPSWAGEDEGAPLVARGQTSSWIGGMDVDGEDDVEAARGGRGRRRTRAADVRDR